MPPPAPNTVPSSHPAPFPAPVLPTPAPPPPRALQPPKVAGAKKAAKPSKLTIDVSVAAKDNVLDPADFEKWLKEHVKVAKKTNNLGEAVTISRDGASKITVSATIPFAKRYLKYLTKKYLRKQQVRDYLRVVAAGKFVYELKYFKLSGDKDLF